MELILAGGSTNTLTAGQFCAGIQVPAGSTLTISGTGELTATGGGSGTTNYDGGAGIGGGWKGTGGNVTIKGGTMTAKGGRGGAGIGGGGTETAAGSEKGMGSNVTIEGGMVTAKGGDSGAGIGGGLKGDGGNVTIKGGTVTATGGRNSAGIGDGNNAWHGGSVTITGGMVEATGGNYGAGIGGGCWCAGGNVTISGGTVIARAGLDAKAIGSGFSASGNGTFEIRGYEYYEYWTNTSADETGKVEGTIPFVLNNDYKYIEIVVIPETIPPTPGNDRLITISDVTYSTLTLNWTVASDNRSTAENLIYYVYQSLSAMSGISPDGTLLNTGGTENIATYRVTGLSPNTTYYFIVVVEDEAGNKAAYSVVSQTTEKINPDVKWPTVLTAVYGQTLADITLPGNGEGTPGVFSWTEDGSTSVGNAGTHTFNLTFTPTDTTSYRTVSQDVTVTVNPKPLTADMLAVQGGSFTYNGTAQTPAISVTDGAVLVPGTDYEHAEYSNNINAGTATVSVTGKGNYTGTVSRNFRIDPATLTITGFAITKTYDGDNIVKGGFGTLAFDGLVNGETADVDTTGVSAVYDDETVGTGKAVAFSGNFGMTGGTANPDNYVIAQPTGITGEIVPLIIPVTGVALNKTKVTLTVGDTETLTATITPPDATNQNVTWTTSNSSVAAVSDGVITAVSAGTATITVTTDDGNKTATCTVTVNPKSSGGISDSGGGNTTNVNSSSVIITPPSPDKPNSPTQAEIKVQGTVDGEGNITVNIPYSTVTNALDRALADARKRGTEQNGITLVIHVSTGSKTGSRVTVNLPKTLQEFIIAKKIVNTILVLDNLDIRIGLDLAAVQEINRQAQSDANITATRTDGSRLSDDARQAIGGRPVFDFRVNYGSGRQVQNFGAGSVSVTIPYTLGADEKAENVQAVYVDSRGNVHWLISSVYDSGENEVRFAASYFSAFGIGYRQTDIAFTDIAGHWAEEDIKFAVSRGLFNGTSATTFSPNIAMTRGMFVTVLGRLANADVSGYTASSFADVKSDAYYMGYIEWARESGIVNGVGDNHFAPDQFVNREQMAVILQNYARAIGYTLPKVHTENIFADGARISDYAKDAVKQMQMAGVLKGKNGNLFDP